MAIRRREFTGALLALGSSSAWATSDEYPNKPITLISSFAGFTELVGRFVAEQMAEELKRPVVVIPKPGANGIIAAQSVATAPPDGYTIFITTNTTHAANQTLFKKLPYDYVKDFAPVSGVMLGSSLICARPSLGVNSVAELTALAKQKAGQLTFGWGSSSARVAIEQYKQLADVDILSVPYKTNPQALNDLLGGRIDILSNDALSSAPLMEAGLLRALAVSGTRRMPLFPQLPTMHEAGVAGYDMPFWLATYAPAATPPAIVRQLNQAIVKVLSTPKAKEFMIKSGGEAFPTTPEELMKFQMAEADKWHQVVTKAGIPAE